MELYRYNNILPLQLIFKNAFPVFKATVRFGECFKTACSQFKGNTAVEHILQFNPISAYILYGRCPYRARYQAQIFQSGISPLHTVVYQVVPNLASPRLNKNVITTDPVFDAPYI